MDRDDREMAVWEPLDMEAISDSFEFWAYVVLVMCIAFLFALAMGAFA